MSNKKSGNRQCIKKSKKKLHKHQIEETDVVGYATEVVSLPNKRDEPPLQYMRRNPQSSTTTASSKFNTNCDLAKSIFRDYEIIGHITRDIIACEQKRMQANKEELNVLKKCYSSMKMEEAAMKRKNWCSQCEMEATYVTPNGPYLFCSQKCEQQASAGGGSG